MYLLGSRMWMRSRHTKHRNLQSASRPGSPATRGSNESERSVMSATISDKSSAFKHVNYLWDDAVAGQLDPVGRLVYRSNLLGSDGRITNTGGGNTSSKVTETDPLTGKPVEVLWVKGSGG